MKIAQITTDQFLSWEWRFNSYNPAEKELGMFQLARIKNNQLRIII